MKARVRLALLCLALGLPALPGIASAPASASAGPLPERLYEHGMALQRLFAGASREATVEPGSAVDLPAPGGTDWQPQDLPAQWGVEGTHRPPLVEQWLMLDYAVPAGAAGRLALYLPRVEGAGVQVATWREEEGRWRMAWDGVDHWREQWNQVVLVDLGPAPAAGRHLQVAVGMVHRTGAAQRLGRPRLGPYAELAGRAQWRDALQQTAPRVGSLGFLTLGVFGLLFWLGRRRERAYLLFFLSSLAWWLGNLHYYTPSPADPTAFQWYWWMTDSSLSWIMVLVYFFALRYDDRPAPRLQRWLIGFVALMSLAGMPFAWSPLHSQVLQHAINAAVALLVLGFLSVRAWRGGSREFRVITGALWLADLMGLHDLLFVADLVPPESIYLLPLASQPLLLAFLYAVQRRYSRAIFQAERLNADLERRLAEREAEVRERGERLAQVEREQALLLERQRLMRDMHDGLGSTLMSSLVLVEQGKLDSAAVAALLRECVDDLRLVIDSLEPIGQDLVTLLASLRHRLGRRLEGAGLQMHWDVDDLPPLEWLQPPDALQVLRIVQEVLTNILKHAGACHIRLATRAEAGQVSVLVEDDGCGFDAAQRARLLIDSQPGAGTRVRLDLPLQRGLSS